MATLTVTPSTRTGAWAEVASVTDASITSGGAIGLLLSGVVTRLDNFGGGNQSAAIDVEIAAISLQGA